LIQQVSGDTGLLPGARISAQFGRLWYQSEKLVAKNKLKKKDRGDFHVLGGAISGMNL
jgi:hypothetical protein